MELGRLKFVDKSVNLLVSGFINDSSFTTDDDNEFPLDIVNVIILFFFQMEKFIKCSSRECNL